MTHSGGGSYAVVWAFRVKAGREAEFERMYGPEGDWARLFRAADGYLATQLWRDVEHPGRYLTIDRWRSREAYDLFFARPPSAYADLDAAGATLTEREERLASLEQVLAVS